MVALITFELTYRLTGEAAVCELDAAALHAKPLREPSGSGVLIIGPQERSDSHNLGAGFVPTQKRTAVA